MSFNLRRVEVADAAAMLKIYEPSVTASHISFELEVPSVSDFKAKIEKISSKYPWYVAEHEGAVLGYAYASLFRERAAYAWALESSIYLAESAQGSTGGAFAGASIAAALYERLFADLKDQGIKQVIAGISLPNAKSVRFHEKMGFQAVGTFPSVGFKLGKWWDVLFMTKFLEDLPFSAPLTK